MESIFGHNLKLIRTVWGQTQDDFGRLFRLSRHNVSSYETGKYDPPINLLLDLEDLTGIPVYQLCTERLEGRDIPSFPDQQGPVKEPQRERPPAPPSSEELLHLGVLVQTVRELRERVEALERWREKELNDR